MGGVGQFDVIRVERYGQITGTTGDTWPNLLDPVGFPLLTDTGRWGVIGVDEGANAEHSDGRLYVFFGDVATRQTGDPPENSDLVAWIDERAPLTRGGHQALGWNFVLPNDRQGAVATTGQPDWKHCVKCGGLFYNGQGAAGACPLGDGHESFGSWNFVLPNRPQGATDTTGQPKWFHCWKCGGIFYNGDGGIGSCPTGGGHDLAGSWEFVIPNRVQGATDTSGQPDWRLCIRCHGLFWDGEASKGLCSASPGGGVHLRAVTRDGTQTGVYDHFRAAEDSPLRYTGTLETPNGAFSFDGVMYVFAGIAAERYSHLPRPENPTRGGYLFSKRDPSQAGPWDVELLFSPRLGWCAFDKSRTSFDSHVVLGNLFRVGQDLAPDAGRFGNFRCCGRCGAVFQADAPGVCQRGGPHEADPSVPHVLSFEISAIEDPQNQTNWKMCVGCRALYWSVEAETGLCPALGRHQPADPVVRVAHVFSPDEPGLDDHHRGELQFCIRCHELVRTDQRNAFPWLAPVVVDNASHSTLPVSGGTGLVMIGFDWVNFRLAWMPLEPGVRPRLETVRYFHAGKRAWTDELDDSDGYQLFAHRHPGQYTHVSAAWLPGPQCWVVAYSASDGASNFFEPIIAMFSTDLLTWSKEVEIFQPKINGAYGAWIHAPEFDHINPDVPPAEPPGQNNPGWPYGAFIIERYTTFDPSSRLLDLHYLMSTSSPYQVQLMHTIVRVPDPIA